jgi:hypothetical protein
VVYYSSVMLTLVAISVVNAVLVVSVVFRSVVAQVQEGQRSVVKKEGVEAEVSWADSR